MSRFGDFQKGELPSNPPKPAAPAPKPVAKKVAPPAPKKVVPLRPEYEPKLEKELSGDEEKSAD